MIDYKKLPAQFISLLFHPLLMPTLTFLLLFRSEFYFSMIGVQVKQYLLLIVFLSTCLLPALTIGLFHLNARYAMSEHGSTYRVLPLVFSSIYYYMGYYMLGKVPVFPVYKLFVISLVLVIVLLMVVSMRWKISIHMAAMGTVAGTLLALALRLQHNISPELILVLLAAGLTGTSRMALGKNTLAQVAVGFGLGFVVLFLILLIL